MGSQIHPGPGDYWKHRLRFKSNVQIPIIAAGAPTNGTSGTGAGQAGPGSLYINSSTGDWYVNTNTKASPTWTTYTNGTGAITPTTVAATGAITSTGSIKSSSSSGGVGYATGAGGSVIQLTDKSTGVTLSKVSGAITLNNASLADATTVTFTVTCTAVATGDVVVVNHASAGTGGAYQVWAHSISNGASYKISVRNVSGGALGEAIVLNVVMLKGVAA